MKCLSSPLPSNRGDSWRVRKIWGDLCTEVYHDDCDGWRGDSKFTILKNELNYKCFTPYIKPKKKSLTAEQARYNKILSNYRGNEERMFGGLKNVFKMFQIGTVFRGHPNR